MGAMPRTWAVMVSFFSIFVLWCIHFNALDLEFPFGTRVNDLPMIELQQDWNKSIITLLSERATRPPHFQYDPEMHDDLVIAMSDASNLYIPTIPMLSKSSSIIKISEARAKKPRKLPPRPTFIADMVGRASKDSSDTQPLSPVGRASKDSTDAIKRESIERCKPATKHEGPVIEAEPARPVNDSNVALNSGSTPTPASTSSASNVLCDQIRRRDNPPSESQRVSDGALPDEN